MNYSLSLSRKSVFTWPIQSHFAKLAPYLYVVALLIVFGIVGRMDYEDEIRAAAFTCEQKYGQQARFIETQDGWYCQPLAEQGEPT